MPIITLLFLSPFNSTLLCHASQMPVYFYPPYCDDHLYGHRIFESVEWLGKSKIRLSWSQRTRVQILPFLLHEV